MGRGDSLGAKLVDDLLPCDALSGKSVWPPGDEAVGLLSCPEDALPELPRKRALLGDAALVFDDETIIASGFEDLGWRVVA